MAIAAFKHSYNDEARKAFKYSMAASIKQLIRTVGDLTALEDGLGRPRRVTYAYRRFARLLDRQGTDDLLKNMEKELREEESGWRTV